MTDKPKKTGFSRRDFLKGAIAVAAAGPCIPAMAQDKSSAGKPSMKTSQNNISGPFYPDDAFSCPTADKLRSFETLVGCNPAGNVCDRALHFSVNDLRLSNGNVVWRMNSKDATEGLIIVEERIRRKPESISIHIKNTSSEPVSISIETHELAWKPVKENVALPWVVGEKQVVGPNEERDLTFSFSDAYCWTDKSAKSQHFPMQIIIIKATGIKPGIEYQLDMRDLTVHYPQASDISVKKLSCPQSITAGKKISMDIEIDGDTKARDLNLEFRQDRWVLWRFRLHEDELKQIATGKCKINRTVPWYIAPGELTIMLVADGYRVTGDEQKATITNNTRPALPCTERRVYNGRPTFFLNGKPQVWQGYSSYDFQPGSVTEFGKSSVNVFCVPACAGRHVHNCAASPTWIAPNEFDFGEIDERVGFSLQSNPDGLIFLRVSLSLPKFWAQENENELARVRADNGDFIWEETNGQAPSLASDIWRRDQEKALRELIRYCKSRPWASRLAGIWVTGAVTEEWFAWGCNEGYFTDYSKPNQARFLTELKKYSSGLEYSKDSPIPSPDTRKKPGYDLFPDENNSKIAALYHQYQSDLAADTICHFAKIVKEKTDGKCLAGAFFGYVIELAGEKRQATGANFAVHRLIDDPNIDFISGIPLLDFRDLTNGYNPYIGATESILSAGKLFCSENDMFSWLHPLIWHMEYNPNNPRAGAISMHRRECANDAVHGVMSQKFSLACSWHHDSLLHTDFRKQRIINENSLKYDRTPTDEIAFVVDESSFAWIPPESTLLAAAHKLLLNYLGRTGAPVSVWLLSDLDKIPDRFKLIVLPNSAAAKPADIEKLKRLIAKGGRTILAIGPAGIVNRNTLHWQPNAAADIFELPIKIDDELLPSNTSFVSGGSSLPEVGKLRPRAYVEGDGFLKYADGKAAGVEKQLASNGKLIWLGIAPLSSDYLRKVAEDARVHCYAPTGCFVHASKELVAITSNVEGDVAINWPANVKIKDLFDGFSARGKDITCQFEAGQTRLFAVDYI